MTRSPSSGAGPDADVVIIGAGLAGAAAAWACTRRGRSVILLEQFAPGHQRGSSHGSARIVRRAYGDGLYVQLTGRAFELWREVELSSDETLLHLYGGLDFGTARDVSEVARLLDESGVEHELLPAAEAEARWPGMRFDSDVVFHPQAGVVDAQRAVDTMVTLARRGGADVRFETPAVAIDDTGRVRLGDGTTVHGATVVVAAGAWLAPLLAAGGPGTPVGLPPLRVTQQQVFHVPRRDQDAAPWPSVIHEGARPVYHLDAGADGGPGRDRKLGEHDAGAATSATDRDGVVDPDSRARILAYVERYLPGLEPVIRSETTCLYTETPSEDFVLDRVGSTVICSPCSGHGAKFAPLIGELVADLVDGDGSSVPARFGLSAHATGATGKVSL